MAEKTDLDQYKKFVKERLKSLLDVVQSVSAGDFSVKVEIPEGEDEFTALSIELERMIDDLIEANRLSEERMARLQAAVEEKERLLKTVGELSSPVIQVWEDVLVMPLVGAIDSTRAARIMEDLLTGITKYQAEIVIIDITGVPVVDTSVANHLVQTIKAASLLGAKCVVVGISSEVAQSLINLGVDLSGVVTRSNLQAGVWYAMEMMGLEVVPKREE
ncbi:MAG: STAS domain-containing protein [Anaerolineae bacterium]